MRLLHEYSNKDNTKNAFVYLTSRGEYMVVVQEVIEKCIPMNSLETAETLAASFTLKDSNGNAQSRTLSV